MSSTRTYSTIVLRTYDVGEADRFCILLTRERGRIAARARGVRRLKSRMGGSLLPFRRVQADIHEGRSGFLITGVHDAISLLPQNSAYGIESAHRGIELLQHLLEDEEPLPDVFDMTEKFLESCSGQQAPLLPFTVRLLSALGMFPLSPEQWRMHNDAETFLHACTTAEAWWCVPTPSAEGRQPVERLCRELVGMQENSLQRAALTSV